MKKIFVFLALIAGVASAQVSSPSIIVVTVDPTGLPCVALPLRVLSPTGVLYTCQGGTLAPITGGGGGGATFPAIAGLVWNTSTTASRNATATDLDNIFGYTPLSVTGSGSGLTGLTFTQLGGTASVAQLPNSAVIVAGTPTTNALTKWTTSNSISNSSLSDNGTTLSTSEAMSVGALTVTSCTGCGSGGSGNTTSTSLTTNAIPKANGANSIINSSLSDSGSAISSSEPASFGALTVPQISVSGSVNGNVNLTSVGTIPAAPAANTIQMTAPNAVTSYQLEMPGVAPTTGNTILNCTAANPSVCTWTAGSTGGAAFPSTTGLVKNTSTTTSVTASGLTDYQVPTKVFYADSYAPLVGTANCTIAGVTYGTAADCAYGAAFNYVTATSSGAVVHLGYGVYEQQIPWLLPCIVGSGLNQINSISVTGESVSASILQAQTGSTFANPMLYRPTTCGNNSNSNEVRDVYLDGNYTAPGIMSMQVGSNMLIENVTGQHSAATTSAFDLGSTTNGSVSGSRVENVNYIGTAGHGGRAVDIQATVTTGALSGFTIGNNPQSIAITAAGSGGTPGNYTWTTTSCSTTGLPGATDPNGSFTVGAGGTITAASLSTTNVGYMCPSSITISTTAATGLTGATLTATMAPNGNSYGQGTPGFTRGIYYGHAIGGFPCTTMPTNLPVLTFNGSGVLTGVALVDGTVASTGAGCTGPVYVWLYSGDPIQYAFSLGAVDLNYDGMIANSGYGSCFNITNGGASYNFLHPFDVCPIGIKVAAFSNLTNIQCDSVTSGCIDVVNGTSTIIGTRSLYDTKASYAGSAKIIYDSLSGGTHAGGGQFAAGGTCGNANFLPSIYNDVIGATGPVSLVPGTTLAGSFPVNSVYLDNTCTSVANKYDAKVNITSETASAFIGPVAGDEGISCSATPTFSSSILVSRCVVASNITTFTLGAGLAGQSKTLCFRQGSGPFTITPPANVVNFTPIGTTNQVWYCQDFSYNLANAIWMGNNTTSGSITPTSIAISSNASLSSSVVALSGALNSTGTATTNFPNMYFTAPGATAVSSFDLAGTYIGFNAPSGFTGTFLQGWQNGVSQWSIRNTGLFNVGSLNATTFIRPATYLTGTNCSANGTAANPSLVACAAAAAGMFSCSATATAGTCVVSDTSVTANSEIFVEETIDPAASTRLGVTCNTPATPLSFTLASRVAGTSFTVNVPTITTNPACYQYHIIN